MGGSRGIKCVALPRIRIFTSTIRSVLPALSAHRPSASLVFEVNAGTRSLSGSSLGLSSCSPNPLGRGTFSREDGVCYCDAARYCGVPFKRVEHAFEFL